MVYFVPSADAANKSRFSFLADANNRLIIEGIKNIIFLIAGVWEADYPQIVSKSRIGGSITAAGRVR